MTYIGINPKKNIIPFIATKLPESYSTNVINEIKLLTFDKFQPPVPFGSYIYRIQKYPGDIDLVEDIRNKNKNATINEIEKSIKKIVKNIKSKKGHYYSEVKTGIDDRYDIDIGEIRNGFWIPSENLLKHLTKLYNKNLLNDNEFTIIYNILKKNTYNQDEYDILYNILRERRILRWTENEILNSEKELPNKKYITLHDALSKKTPTKVDELTYIDNKLTEITNFIAYGYYKNDKLIPINVDLEEQHNKLIQLPPEIEKLYFSNFYYSPFKMLKRMYSFARSTHNEKLLLKIIPFISSNISLLYQIKSEIDNIILLLTKIKAYPKIHLKNELENMKNRLENIIEIPNTLLFKIFLIIDKINKTTNKSEKNILLKNISNIFKRIINYETINYLNTVGLNPPPKYVLPPTMKYKYIKRNALDFPNI